MSNIERKITLKREGERERERERVELAFRVNLINECYKNREGLQDERERDRQTEIQEEREKSKSSISGKRKKNCS